MAGEGEFPKVSNDILYASEANQFSGKITGYAISTTLASSDCTGNQVVSNEGATSTVTFTLPAASDSRRIKFINVENQDLVVECYSGDKLYSKNNTSGVTSLTLSRQYSDLVVSKLADSKWYVEGDENTLSREDGIILSEQSGNWGSMSLAITIPTGIKRLRVIGNSGNGGEGTVAFTLNNVSASSYAWVEMEGRPSSTTTCVASYTSSYANWIMGVAGDVNGWGFDSTIVLDYASVARANIFSTFVYVRSHSSDASHVTTFTGWATLTAQPTTFTISGASGSGKLTVIGYYV